MKQRSLAALITLILLIGGLLQFQIKTTVATPDARIDAAVLSELNASGQANVLIQLPQPDLSHAYELPDKTTRGQWVVATLRTAARQFQAPIVAELEKAGVAYQPFWAVDAIQVQIDADLLARLLRYPQIQRIAPNQPIRGVLPDEGELSAQAASSSPPWGVTRVQAPWAWEQGFTGQDVVIAGQDTGYDWEHPTLKTHYRGYDVASGEASHDYNWHDAIHQEDSASPAANPCGLNLAAPCDDWGHGTHTMGTMLGNDLAGDADNWPQGASHLIGVAPGAQWVACRNMESGFGRPATYIECFQWFIAPWTAEDPTGDISKAPDIINNSWSCPTSEGCTPDKLAIIEPALNAADAAGILVVVSASNAGPTCGSIKEPPAIYPLGLTVGATNSRDALASFSSRGPVTYHGQQRTGPDLSAPGVGVLSAIPKNRYANMSGTSMAGPHVAGVAALLLSAEPTLKGQPAMLRAILTRSTDAITTTNSCGGDTPSTRPNNSFGWGIVNARSAIESLTQPVTITATLRDIHGDPLLEAGHQITLHRYPAGPQVASGITDANGQVEFTTSWGKYLLLSTDTPQTSASSPLYAVGGTEINVDVLVFSHRIFLPVAQPVASP